MNYIKISPNDYNKFAIVSYGDLCIELSPDFLKELINLTDSNISNFQPQQRTIFRKFNKNLGKILESMGELTINKPSYESVFEYTQKLFTFEYSLLVDYTINLSKEQSIDIKLLHKIFVLGIDQNEALDKINKLFELKNKKFLIDLFSITHPQTLEIIKVNDSNLDNKTKFEELVEKMQGIFNFMNHSSIKESTPDKDSLTFISQEKFVNEQEQQPCSCGSC